MGDLVEVDGGNFLLGEVVWDLFLLLEVILWFI